MSTPSQWQYFSKEELTCHCGCGRMEMNDEFMAKMVAMRRSLGFSFAITSGFRCSEYNKKISSTGEKGPHTTGHAMDILVSHQKALQIVDAARDFEFTGVGLKQHGPVEGRYVHLDDLQAPAYPRPHIWTYP